MQYPKNDPIIWDFLQKAKSDTSLSLYSSKNINRSKTHCALLEFAASCLTVFPLFKLVRDPMEVAAEDDAILFSCPIYFLSQRSRISFVPTAENLLPKPI